MSNAKVTWPFEDCQAIIADLAMFKQLSWHVQEGDVRKGNRRDSEMGFLKWQSPSHQNCVFPKVQCKAFQDVLKFSQHCLPCCDLEVLGGMQMAAP